MLGNPVLTTAGDASDFYSEPGSMIILSSVPGANLPADAPAGRCGTGIL
jgi:hypothetical protein